MPEIIARKFRPSTRQMREQPCGESGPYIGNAVRLSDEEETQILMALQAPGAAAEAYEQRIKEPLGRQVSALREVLEWATGGIETPDYGDFYERALKALAATAEAYEKRVREDERRNVTMI